MPKCINRRPHHAFEPFLQSTSILGTSANGMVSGKSLIIEALLFKARRN